MGCRVRALWVQLAGSRPLVRPRPVTGRPGPLMTASSQPDLLAQASYNTHRAKDTHAGLNSHVSRLYSHVLASRGWWSGDICTADYTYHYHEDEEETREEKRKEKELDDNGLSR